jgi:hypothetical protein
MLPDISNRISNLSKALEGVIIPAIGEGESFAAEQAALMLGHLKMLDQQWDKAYLYEKGSFDNMVALASTLSHYAEGGQQSQLSNKTLVDLLANLPDILPLTVSAISTLIADLGHAVDALIRAAYSDGSPEFKAALFTTVLDYNRCQSARERTWFKSNNLDPDVRDLPDMDDMLNSSTYLYEGINQ